MGYSCEFCGSEFNLQSNLITHKRTAKYCLAIRGKIPTTCACKICGKEFTIKSNLKIHEKKCNYKIPKNIQRLIDKKDEEIIKINEEIEAIKERCREEIEEVEERCREEVREIEEKCREEVGEIEERLKTIEKENGEIKAKLKALKLENIKVRSENAKLISDTKAAIYEKEYNAIRDKPTTATYNNTTNNKLKLVNTSTIDPFTIDTVHSRLQKNEFTYGDFMSGINGIKRFIMGMVTKDDEKNYVTTDTSRSNFHRLEETRRWINDKGALFLNKVFDEMKPSVQAHWDRFMAELKTAKNFEDYEVFDAELERVKPIACAIIGSSESKPRKDLLDDVIKYIKPRVAI